MDKKRELPRGVLTIATGQSRYMRLAVNMAKSCRLHNPALPLAIVTDWDRAQVPPVFDFVVPLDPAKGTPLRQKLYIDEYSPFQETLFIDSDCLVAGNLNDYFHRLGVNDLGIAGTIESSGHWYADITDLCRQIGREAIPRINSGLIFIRKTAAVHQVLKLAREFMDSAPDYGIPATHGQQSDEPALSLAMATHRMLPIPSKCDFMPTHISGGFEAMDIDVVGGSCWYRIDGQTYHPKVAHFLAWRWQSPVYRREALKLRIVRGRQFHDRSLAAVIDLGFGIRSQFRAVYRTIAGRKPKVANHSASTGRHAVPPERQECAFS